MAITYQTTVIPTTAEIIDVYNSSGIKRPTNDAHRIAKMYANSDLVVTAWDGDLLVGVARSLTDFCYACYLSDLAVRLEYQKLGIGKELVRLTRREITEQSMVLLLSAPTAMEYYPKIGMDKMDSAFMFKREK